MWYKPQNYGTRFELIPPSSADMESPDLYLSYPQVYSDHHAE